MREISDDVIDFIEERIKEYSMCMCDTPGKCYHEGGKNALMEVMDYVCEGDE